jgi:hypothetical protein
MSSLIRNSNQVKQAIDYSGLERGSIYFSDVDAKIEMDERFSIAVEVKRPFNEIPDGQRLLLERDAIAWIKAGEYDIVKYIESRNGGLIMPGQIKRLKRESIVIKAEYMGDSDDELIPLHECIVTKVFKRKTDNDTEMMWVELKNSTTMKEYLDTLITEWGVERLIKSTKGILR